MAKQNVIIAHGHLYLFWSTGIYYTNELVNRYNVVLLVPEFYRSDQRFATVCEAMKISDIIYYNYCGKHLKRHIDISKLLKRTILTYQPIAVLQHDYIGIENMYLFHWTNKLLPKSVRVVVLSSMPSTDQTSATLAAFFDSNVERYACKTRLPRPLVKILLKMAKLAISFMSNMCLPVFVLKSRPYFGMSLHSNIDIVPFYPLFDYFLVYAANEKRYLDKLFAGKKMAQKAAFQLVKSSFSEGQQINQLLYPQESTCMVSIFPSLIGLRSFEDEETTLKKWVIGLDLLKSQLPDYQFLIKFHPGNKSELMKRVQSYFKMRCNYLNVIDSSVAAEKLMLSSQVVVGDVSTTLWWANQLADKVVISFGMGDYTANTDLKPYPGIIYVEKMELLAGMDIAARIADKSSATGGDGCPRLLDFIASVV